MENNNLNNIVNREIPAATPEVQQYPDRVIMDPDLNDGSVQPRQVGEPVPASSQENTTPVNGQTNDVMQEVAPSNKYSGMRMLTPEEAAQFEDGPRERIGGNTAADKEGEFKLANDEAIERIRNQPKDEFISSLAGALEAETARQDEMMDLMEDPEKRAKVFEGMEDPIKKREDEKNVVTPIAVSREKDRTVIDDSELVPSYDDEEEEKKEKEAERKARDEAAEENGEGTSEGKAVAPIDPTDEELKEYVNNLKPSRAEETENVLETVKEKLTVISSNRTDPKRNLSDSAFASAVTKFKKDNFRTVSVPLLNSGFVANVVGTGPVDLNLLYSDVNEETTEIDYELEKMRIMIRNVTGTTPRVPAEDLRNMIHYVDYNMLSYAHVAATLKELELLQTCSGCGEDYRIVTRSSDIILNMDEIREKANAIRNASTIEENSLMMKDKEFNVENGTSIIIGHPSYAEYIQYTVDMKNLLDTPVDEGGLNDFEKKMFSELIPILPYIRSIVLPNGVRASSVWQKYVALGLLSETEMIDLNNAVTKMTREIITPIFGVKSVKCPRCGKVHTNVRYPRLDNMLFFHFTVTRLINSTED